MLENEKKKTRAGSERRGGEDERALDPPREAGLGGRGRTCPPAGSAPPARPRSGSPGTAGVSRPGKTHIAAEAPCPANPQATTVGPGPRLTLRPDRGKAGGGGGRGRNPAPPPRGGRRGREAPKGGRAPPEGRRGEGGGGGGGDGGGETGPRDRPPNPDPRDPPPHPSPPLPSRRPPPPAAPPASPLPLLLRPTVCASGDEGPGPTTSRRGGTLRAPPAAPRPRPRRTGTRDGAIERESDAQTGVAPGGTRGRKCVRSVDDQCVLQFTLILAASCVLHRRTSRVIHR